jgi:hypothetical protein
MRVNVSAHQNDSDAAGSELLERLDLPDDMQTEALASCPNCGCPLDNMPRPSGPGKSGLDHQRGFCSAAIGPIRGATFTPFCHLAVSPRALQNRFARALTTRSRLSPRPELR